MLLNLDDEKGDINYNDDDKVKTGEILKEKYRKGESF